MLMVAVEVFSILASCVYCVYITFIWFLPSISLTFVSLKKFSAIHMVIIICGFFLAILESLVTHLLFAIFIRLFLQVFCH
jgi:hypothetical protein